MSTVWIAYKAWLLIQEMFSIKQKQVCFIILTCDQALEHILKYYSGVNYNALN